MSSEGDIVDRITAYLSNGGLFNPELADHDAVRDLLIDCHARIAELEAENRQWERRVVDLEAELHRRRADIHRLLKKRERMLRSEDSLVTENGQLREALKNMVSLASPYFTDAPQRAAISEARAALEDKR